MWPPGWLCWHLLSQEAAPAPPRASGLPDRIVHPSPAAWPERGTPELRERLREPAARWLDSRGRAAAGLIAIWDLCRDPDILKEAASRFPDNPRVCRAMVEAYSGDMTIVLRWSEQLITLEPKNSEGHYLKAWALFTKGRDAEALTALRGATAIGLPREARLRDRASLLRDAATALGLPHREAALAPIEFLRSQDLARRFYYRMGQSLTALMDQAQAAGDPETVAKLGRTALATALNQRHGFDSPPLIADEAAGYDFTLSILGRLPEDWRWDPQSLTAAEWQKHAREAATQLVVARDEARFIHETLGDAPDEVVAAYTGQFLNYGEAKANAWLLAQPRPENRD